MKTDCTNHLVQAPKESGGKPVSDQLLPPFVIVDDKDAPVGAVQDGDAVIIFNFRADRVVEISKALEYEKFDKFERRRFPKVRLEQGHHWHQSICGPGYLSAEICVSAHV